MAELPSPRHDSMLLSLPTELLESIVWYLDPLAALAFGSTCTQANQLTHEPLVWRKHCAETWRHWADEHEFHEKLRQPPSQTRWKDLFMKRRQRDQEMAEAFEKLLVAQQHRIHRIEEIAKNGDDVTDLFGRILASAHEHKEDVLARKFHANMILRKLHRHTALKHWRRLQQGKEVTLEQALCAYDLFVLSVEKGDLVKVEKKLDDIAAAIRARDPDFDDLSVRRRAIQIARYLRSANLVGNAVQEDYHALRNNFLSLALFEEPHTSLPLQSVAIYCAVARRLGLRAQPMNHITHVHAIVWSPEGATLDGITRPSESRAERDCMFMDPWLNSEEVSPTQLSTSLSLMNISIGQQAVYLAPAGVTDMTLRAGRNIMTSVQDMHERRRGMLPPEDQPDVESAWYAMLWSMLLLGDTEDNALQRRRQCLPYFLDNFSTHFSEDIGLVETIILPMFENEREHSRLLDLANRGRAADDTRKAPLYRTAAVTHVKYKIGTYFIHRRYEYPGIIIGWSPQCDAEPGWIQQMRVDELPRGRTQPFYHIVAEDKSIRYVAEENISQRTISPSSRLLNLAGRYFKRFDEEKGIFVSNIREEFPDD